MPLKPDYLAALPDGMVITHREGEILSNTEVLPDGGTITRIEFGRDLPSHTQQEYAFTFRNDVVTIQAAGLRRAKDRGGIAGSGDYGTHYILNKPGLFTVDVKRGCDGLPPINAEWWKEVIDHENNRKVIFQWLSDYFPDIQPGSIYHPDVMHSAIQSKLDSHPYHRVNTCLRNLYETLVETIPRDDSVVRYTRTFRPATDNGIPYPLTKTVISTAQLELFRNISLMRQATITQLYPLFYSVHNELGFLPHQLFDWFFNGISAQTMTVIMQRPVLFDGRESRIVTSRFMSTADCVGHTDFGFDEDSNNNLPLPNSNRNIDFLIDQYVKPGKSANVVIATLVEKTQASYVTYTQFPETHDYQRLVALNGLYALTTEPLTTMEGQPLEILTSVQSDGEHYSPERNRSMQYSDKIRALARMRLAGNYEPQGNIQDDGLNISSKISINNR